MGSFELPQFARGLRWLRRVGAALIFGLGIFPISVGAIGIVPISSIRAVKNHEVSKPGYVREFCGPGIIEVPKQVYVFIAPEKFADIGAVQLNFDGRCGPKVIIDRDDEPRWGRPAIGGPCIKRVFDAHGEAKASEERGTSTEVFEFIIDPNRNHPILVRGGSACRIANNLDKATCDASHTLSKAVCDIQQEIGRFYKHNPIAVLETEVKPNIAISGAINHASVNADLSQLSVNATVAGSGSVEAGLKYVRKTATDAALGPGAGWGLCTFNWAETTHVDVSAKSIPYDAKFTGTFEDDPGKESVLLKYKLAEKLIVMVDFSPPPIDAIFGKTPHLILNCPTAVVGAFTLGTAEAILTKEDARKVLPAITGHNYPFEIEDADFTVKIPKLVICRTTDRDKCSKNSLELFPHTSSNAVIFEVRK